MINKTVRGEAALGCNFKQRFLSPHPLFWQLAPVKHEIPPNLRSGIFYRHNKVLSPPSSGRERESRSGVYLSLGKCPAQAHAVTAGDIGAQGCQRKRFLPNVVITRSGEHCSVQQRVIVREAQVHSLSIHISHGGSAPAAAARYYYHSNGSSRLTEKNPPD